MYNNEYYALKDIVQGIEQMLNYHNTLNNLKIELKNSSIIIEQDTQSQIDLLFETLNLCCLKRKQNIIEQLIKEKHINLSIKKNNTTEDPIWFSLQPQKHSNTKQFFELFLKNDFNINQTNKNNETILFKYNQLSVKDLIFYLQYNININIKDKDNKTPVDNIKNELSFKNTEQQREILLIKKHIFESFYHKKILENEIIKNKKSNTQSIL